MDEKLKQPPPIVYPTIEVPGHGTYPVKFDLGAQFTLDDEYGMDEKAVARMLADWSPRPTSKPCPECLGDKCDRCFQSGFEQSPGHVRPSDLWKVLSACIWDDCPLPPRQLAKCFEYHEDLTQVALAILDAFAKTKWSRRPMAPAATGQQEPSTTRPAVN